MLSISHPREIYKDDSPEFYNGVFAHFTGTYNRAGLWLETKDFKRGYWKGENNNLKDKYIIVNESS